MRGKLLLSVAFVLAGLFASRGAADDGEPSQQVASSVHLYDREFDGRVVAVEAVVRSVQYRPDGQLELSVKCGLVPLRILVAKGEPVRAERLIDAQVLAGGTIRQRTNPEGDVTSVVVETDGLDAIEVVRAAPDDPFSAPLLTHADLVQNRNELHRVRFRGRVIYVSANRRMMIVVDDAGGRVVLDLTRGSVAPESPGDRIDAVGFAAVQGDSVTLHEALFRVVVPAPWWTVGKLWTLAELLALALAAVIVVSVFRRRRAKAEMLAVTRERARIAFDLHDDMQQLLAGTMCYLKAAENFAARGSDRTASQIAKARESLSHAQTTLRRILWGLQAEGENSGSLMSMLRYVANYLPHWRESVRFEVSGSERKVFPPRAATQILLCLQEAVTNAIGHGEAAHVVVKVDFSPVRVRLTVTDDGRGFDSSATAEGIHLGLESMRARMREFGGVLEIESENGKGTVLTIEVPYA